MSRQHRRADAHRGRRGGLDRASGRRGATSHQGGGRPPGAAGGGGAGSDVEVHRLASGRGPGHGLAQASVARVLHRLSNGRDLAPDGVLGDAGRAGDGPA